MRGRSPRLFSAARLFTSLLLVPAMVMAADSTQLTLTETQIGAMAVKVQKVELAKSTPVGLVPGRVVMPPASQRVITLPFDGVIVGLHAQDGQTVKAGQALATLRSRDAGLAVAEASRLSSVAKIARTTADRDHALVAEGIAASRRAAESEADAQAASAAADAAQSAVRDLQRNPARADEFVLVAPIAGQVEERGLRMASEVKANSVGFVITSGDERWIEAQLPERLLDSVHVGDDAAVMLNAGSVDGRIIAIGRQIDATTRSVLLRASLDVARATAAAKQLIPGYIVQLQLASRSSAGSSPGYRVPESAVVRIGDREVVFARNSAGFAVVPVTSSARVGGFAVVNGALDAGSSVAIGGVSALKALAQAE